MDTSASLSRSRMKSVAEPAGRLSPITWPSTHTAPSRSTHWPIMPTTWRTGTGASGGVDSGMSAPYGVPPTMEPMDTALAMPRVPPADEAQRAVLLAAPRGYCAGVDRAVITVEKALDLYGSPVYVRKQIVHNKHVVADLESRGAVFVEELAEVPTGATVVFSAHGVSPEVHRQAEERELKTIDATCPLVTKVHHEARRFAAEDYDILLIGHAGHEEVEGTAGEAPGHVQLVDGPEGVASVRVRDPEKVVWLSQTTLSVDETMETVRQLRE